MGGGGIALLTDLCTELERRSTLKQNWIDGLQLSPEGQPALRRKIRHIKNHKIAGLH